jgi:hypothetical protein
LLLWGHVYQSFAWQQEEGYRHTQTDGRVSAAMIYIPSFIKIAHAFKVHWGDNKQTGWRSHKPTLGKQGNKMTAEINSHLAKSNIYL